MAGEYDDDEDMGYGGSGYGGMPGLAVLGMPPQITTPEAQKYARRFLDESLSGDAEEESDAYMDRVRAQTEAARNALQAARAKIEARRRGNSDIWLAAAAALGSPTRTGSIGETAANVASSLREPMEAKRKFQYDKEDALSDIDLRLSQMDSPEIAAQLQLLKMKQELRGKRDVKALDILGRPLNTPQTKTINAAVQAGDRNFAKTYNEWAVEGGAASAQKSLDDLKAAQSLLESGRDDLTGPLVGAVGKIKWLGPWMESLALPDAANLKQTVEYTVQQSLRPILGAQFTENEGERLINRVYNPMLDEKTNALRVKALRRALLRAADQKNEAARYWEKYHTLGPTPENPEGFRARIHWDDARVEDLLPPGSLPGDDKIPTKNKPQASTAEPLWRTNPETDPWGGAETIDYEDLVEAGGDPMQIPEERHAEGGLAGQRVQHTMRDGRVITAPAGVPEEAVRARYEASQQAMNIHPVVDVDEEVPSEEVTQEEPPPGLGDEGEIEPVAENTRGLQVDNPTLIELGGSALGHSLMGAAGGRYGTKLAQTLPDVLPGRRIRPAEGRVLQALENEGLNPTEWSRLVAQARKLGVPANAMDMGGLEIRALGEQALNPANKGTRDFYQDLQARQTGAGSRVDDVINRGLKPDPFLPKLRELRKNLKDNGKQLYPALYAKYPSVKSQQLFQLMKTPSGEKAVKRAVRSIQDRPGATIGKADAAGMVTKPSLEFLDQVKDELDDMIIEEEGEGANFKKTKKSTRLRELRQAFRDELDAATTDPKTKKSDYKEARAQYAGDIEVIDALKYGRDDFNTVTPDEFADYVKDLNFSEKDALRTGVAHSLMDQLSKTSNRSNPAQRLIGTPAQLAKLEVLFDKPNEFKIFKEALELEAKLYEDSAPTIRKAKSEIRTMSNPKDNVLRRTARKAPFNVFSPTAWAVKLLRWKEGLKPQEADEILKMLRTNDVARMKKLEENLGPKFGRAQRRKGRAKIGTIAGAIAGAGVPIYRELTKNEPDEEEEPKFARGGLVRRSPKWKTVTELALNSAMYGEDDLVSSLIR